MTFKEYFMDEAFDRPYKWKLDITGFNGTKYFNFTTDDDIFYLVTLTRPERVDIPYTALSFETEDGEMNLTGTGDAFRIFATVLDIIKKEKKNILEYGDFRFAADADEPSRVKLYQIMAKKLKKLLGYKKLKINKGRNISFRFSKD